MTSPGSRLGISSACTSWIPLKELSGENIRPALDIKPKLPDGVKTIRNLEYANPGGIRSLLLDLYLPAKESDKPLPVVMWIHGGGWSKGQQGELPADLAGE